MRWRWIHWAALLAAPLATTVTGMLRADRDAVRGLQGALLGRQVYIAEGCIHCHSQFIRPRSPDVDVWGPARDPEFSRQQHPALIGNRRQGPDLMNVGARRTREWQRLHLLDPRRVSPGSRMPSYAHLFAPGDLRGEALLDYLDSLGREEETPASSTKPRHE